MSKQKFDFDLDEGLEETDDLPDEEQASAYPVVEEEHYPSVQPQQKRRQVATREEAPPQQEDLAESVLEDLFAPEHSADLIDLDNDIKQRLDVAKYYNMLFTTNLFAEHNSKAAVRVQREIMRFAESRLKDLMGISGKSANPTVTTIAAKLPFSEPQVEALKMLADKVLQQKGTAVPAQQPPVPKIVEKAPEVKLKPIPKEQPKPEIRLQEKPVAPRPKAPPPVQAKPKANANSMSAEERQAFIEARVPPQYHKDESLVIKEGKAFVHVRDENNDNKYLFVYDPILKKTMPMQKDVTLPNRPKGYTPSTWQEGNRIAEAQAPGILGAATSGIESKARALSSDGRGKINTGIVGDQLGMALISAFTKDSPSNSSETDINDM